MTVLTAMYWQMESVFTFPSLAKSTHKNGYVLVYKSLPLPADLLSNAMVIVFFSILPPFCTLFLYIWVFWEYYHPYCLFLLCQTFR